MVQEVEWSEGVEERLLSSMGSSYPLLSLAGIKALGKAAHEGRCRVFEAGTPGALLGLLEARPGVRLILGPVSTSRAQLVQELPAIRQFLEETIAQISPRPKAWLITIVDPAREDGFRQSFHPLTMRDGPWFGDDLVKAGFSLRHIAQRSMVELAISPCSLDDQLGGGWHIDQVPDVPIDLFIEVYNETIQDAPNFVPMKASDFDDAAPGTLRVLFVNDTAAGFFNFSPYEGILCGVGVRKPFRGTWVTKLLIASALEAAAVDGRVLVDIDERNLVATRVACRYGAVPLLKYKVYSL